MPERIQRKRTKGWKLPDGAICVTRPGKWGNPFERGVKLTRDSDLWPYAAELVPGGVRDLTSFALLRPEELVEAHFRWFVEQPHLMMAVEEELGGHDLACFCKIGAACHGDFLLSMANNLIEAPDAP